MNRDYKLGLYTFTCTLLLPTVQIPNILSRIGKSNIIVGNVVKKRRLVRHHGLFAANMSCDVTENEESITIQKTLLVYRI